MTNGEKFQQIFAVSQVDECDLNVYAWLPCHDAIEIPLEWWNTNYSEIPTGSTTKNDLGVECISRADVKAKKIYSHERHEYVVPVAEIDWLPSVTPQEPMIVPIAEIKYDKDKLKELVNKAVLTVTPQEPRWIPVSERLPEDIKPVIVTWKNTDPESYYQYIVGKYFIGTAHYKSGKWYWYSSVTEDLLAEYGKCDSEEFDEAIEVVAWMPLPQPYQPEIPTGAERSDK